MRQKEVIHQELINYQSDKLAKYGKDNQTQAKGALVFAGDSIIDFFPLKKYFNHPNLINRGVAGADTKWLLTNIDNYILDLEPDQIFFLIGTNDLGLARSVADILAYFSEIISHIKKENLLTKIHIISVLPVNESDSYADIVKVRSNHDIKELNSRLAVMPGIEFISAHSQLLDDKGQLDPLYTTDGLHLSPEGYQKLAEVILPYL